MKQSARKEPENKKKLITFFPWRKFFIPQYIHAKLVFAIRRTNYAKPHEVLRSNMLIKNKKKQIFK